MLALYLSDVTGTKAQWETAVAAHRLDAQPYMAGTAGRSGCHGRFPLRPFCHLERREWWMLALGAILALFAGADASPWGPTEAVRGP